ncbi:MAG: hypothetical protein APF81_11925 [Desulfosporosinus sp. BRH_c37]|nr:MAG: hypothetical protein APF81_11925 [Desulfosporosinus sp. BRH_c37]
MGDLNFLTTAILFACLGYGLCYLAMAKPGRQPMENNLSEDDFSRLLTAREYAKSENTGIS